MILHDHIDPTPIPALPFCGVCGLSWTTRDEAEVCCLPGLAAYERGDIGGVEIQGFPPRKYGGVAYIEDRAALVAAIERARNGRTWHEFTESAGLYESFFQNMMTGAIDWVQEIGYRELVKIMGSPVPGLLYWPPEASAPTWLKDWT